jgi:uncharacterized protein (DUF1778 family)
VSTDSKAKKSRQAHSASARINLRVNPRQKAVILQAAKIQKLKLTEFVLNSSQAAAEEVLTERSRFILASEKWRQFNDALDAPPREIPALRKLFNEPSVFKKP